MWRSLITRIGTFTMAVVLMECSLRCADAEWMFWFRSRAQTRGCINQAQALREDRVHLWQSQMYTSTAAV